MNQIIRLSLRIAVIIFLLNSVSGVPQLFAQPIVKYEKKTENPDCPECTTTRNCIEGYNGSKISTTSFAGNGLLISILVLLTFYLYTNRKLKIYLVGGGTLIVILLGSSYFSRLKSSEALVRTDDFVVDTVVGTLTQIAESAEFKPAGDEFGSLNGVSDSEAKSEFSGSTAKEKDEFAPVSDEFAPLDGDKDIISSGKTTAGSAPADPGPTDVRFLIELGILFSLLAIVGMAIRYPAIRNYRGLVMMGTMVYFGFYKGGCPCMISSFQNTILAILGKEITIISMLWFLGLIPLTYLFGKIWCGWLCHLGALQEFIFLPPKLKLLQTTNNQRMLRYMRGVFLIILLVQLMITRTNLFIHYDPLKVAFNLFSANTTGYVLLALLLVSSVLIYRPFCRAVCPVGLVLGWVALLPGAKRLTKDKSCIDCSSCSKPCKSHAMIYENKISSLQIQDCILCGDCMGSCKKGAIQLNRSKI